ncbi:MAG: acetyl-CoA carboxylase carboxyl transferase subunit beta, partial [Pseudomonadota bacterium]
DMVVPRTEMKDTISDLLTILMHRPKRGGDEDEQLVETPNVMGDEQTEAQAALSTAAPADAKSSGGANDVTAPIVDQTAAKPA